MARLPTLLALVAGLAGAAIVATSASAANRTMAVVGLTVRGHGLGHGIGLSQWGAENRALAGEDYQGILSFYYPGARLADAPRAAIRVLLADRVRVHIGSASGIVIRDAGGHVAELPAGLYEASADGIIGGRRFVLPVVVRSSSTPLALGATYYRGTFALVSAGSHLLVVNTLPLEEYVQGVVSSECPGYWAQQALRAQAVASRTYALAHLQPTAAFDVYPDDRSQRYHGLLRDYASARTATRATAGQVLRFGGELIQAFFSADNGGLTDVTQGIWDGPALPYFVSRPDPYDARSPATDWGPVRLTIGQLRSVFPELPAQIASVAVRRNDGGRVALLAFSDADGVTAAINGYTFQQRLGLRSTFFSIDADYSAAASG